MVKVKIPHSTKISYTMVSTGDKGNLVTTNGKIMLSIGRIYKVPVDTKEALDDHNLFKVSGKLNESLDIRNVEDGFATIRPLIHEAVIITDNMELGSFI